MPWIIGLYSRGGYRGARFITTNSDMRFTPCILLALLLQACSDGSDSLPSIETPPAEFPFLSYEAKPQPRGGRATLGQ